MSDNPSENSLGVTASEMHRRLNSAIALGAANYPLPPQASTWPGGALANSSGRDNTTVNMTISKIVNGWLINVQGNIYAVTEAKAIPETIMAALVAHRITG